MSPLVEEKSVQKLRQEAVMRWSVVGSGAFAVCILGWLAIR